MGVLQANTRLCLVILVSSVQSVSTALMVTISSGTVLQALTLPLGRRIVLFVRQENTVLIQLSSLVLLGRSLLQGRQSASNVLQDLSVPIRMAATSLPV